MASGSNPVNSDLPDDLRAYEEAMRAALARQAGASTSTSGNNRGAKSKRRYSIKDVLIENDDDSDYSDPEIANYKAKIESEMQNLDALRVPIYEIHHPEDDGYERGNCVVNTGLSQSMDSTKVDVDLEMGDLPSVLDSFDLEDISFAHLGSIFDMAELVTDVPAYEPDTALLLDDGLDFVFEVLGQVYAARFDSFEDAKNSQISAGLEMHGAPADEHAQYVSSRQLLQVPHVVGMGENELFGHARNRKSTAEEMEKCYSDMHRHFESMANRRNQTKNRLWEYVNHYKGLKEKAKARRNGEGQAETQPSN